MECIDALPVPDQGHNGWKCFGGSQKRGRAVWDVKLHDSFAWTGQEIMTVRILGVGKWGKVKLQPWMSGQQHLAC